MNKTQIKLSTSKLTTLHERVKSIMESKYGGGLDTTGLRILDGNLKYYGYNFNYFQSYTEYEINDALNTFNSSYRK